MAHRRSGTPAGVKLAGLATEGIRDREEPARHSFPVPRHVRLARRRAVVWGRGRRREADARGAHRARPTVVRGASSRKRRPRRCPTRSRWRPSFAPRFRRGHPAFSCHHRDGATEADDLGRRAALRGMSLGVALARVARRDLTPRHLRRGCAAGGARGVASSFPRRPVPPGDADLATPARATPVPTLARWRPRRPRSPVHRCSRGGHRYARARDEVNDKQRERHVRPRAPTRARRTRRPCRRSACSKSSVTR